MKVSFDKACAMAASEVAQLRAQAADKRLFDLAVENMRAQRWVCNTRTGTTRNVEGVQGQFVAYDWEATYNKFPDHVFYDFFRGHLLNKVSRLARGLSI